MHTIKLSLAVLLTFALIGCNRTPSDELNIEIEKRVRAAADEDVVKLDAKTLNDIVAAQIHGHGNVSYGTIYDVTGQVRHVHIGVNEEGEPDNKKQVLRSVVLVVELPDYVAADIEGWFALEHREMIESIAPGTPITLRGELFDDGEDRGQEQVYLAGAVIVKQGE